MRKSSFLVLAGSCSPPRSSQSCSCLSVDSVTSCTNARFPAWFGARSGRVSQSSAHSRRVRAKSARAVSTSAHSDTKGRPCINAIVRSPSSKTFRRGATVRNKCERSDANDMSVSRAYDCAMRTVHQIRVSSAASSAVFVPNPDDSVGAKGDDVACPSARSPNFSNSVSLDRFYFTCASDRWRRCWKSPPPIRATGSSPSGQQTARYCESREIGPAGQNHGCRGGRVRAQGRRPLTPRRW